jgi:uncharacterized RDD family membrane protein YckC
MTPDPTRVVLRRIGAFGVDGLLVALVVVFVVWVSGSVATGVGACPDPIPQGRSCLEYRGTFYEADHWSFLWWAVLLVVTFLLVFGVVPGVTGASPGKSLFGIRVALRDGSDAGWRRGLVRGAAWVVDAIAVIIPIALWGALFAPGHRRVGDFLAGTFVVRTRAVPDPAPRWLGRRVGPNRDQDRDPPPPPSRG